MLKKPMIGLLAMTAALILTSTACSTRGPLRLSLMPSQTTSGTNRAVGVNADLAMEALYPNLTYEVQGDLSVDRISGFAWTIVPRSRSVARFRDLAESLGVVGEVKVNGKNSYTVGADDGTGPGMWLWVDDGGSWWSYSSGSTATVANACVRAPVEVSPNASPDASPDDSVEPCTIVEPPKPKNLLSENDALLRTYTLMAAARYNLSAFEMKVTRSDWLTDVSGALVIGQTTSNIKVSMSFGEDGVLTYASGPFVHIKRANGYFLITPEEGVKRLNDPRYASWTGVARGATDITVGAPTRNSQGLSQSTVVPITGVRYILMQTTLSNLSTILMPAYTYTNRDGDVGTVIAIKDEYLRFDDTPAGVERGPAPITGGGTGGSAGGSEGSLPTEPPRTDESRQVTSQAASKLIGLTEADAVAVAKNNRWTVRIASRDDEPFMLTADYSASRVNLTIVEGLVTSVSIG